MTLPSRLRDYEIWGRLSEGGMSEVWLAKHTVLTVPVIFKTIKPEVADTQTKGEGLARRVIEEARLMARITDPRVVRAIDAGVHEGTPYMVQEYVDGIDLAELDRRRRLSLGVGLPLWFVCVAMRQACEALHAAHQSGVVHRDMKPSNLFGSPTTGVRLGDFGVAVGRETKKKEVSGTLRFMAPEQLTQGEATRRTDVWGAGATACDLRYGRPPFERVSGVLDDSPPNMPPPRTAAEAYFQHLLGTMLHKVERERPSEMSELARQFGTLADALGGTRRIGFVFVDRHTFRIGECTVTFRAGDIAEARADAIVNSANFEMKMRSGVGDALRKKGGDAIEDDARVGGEQALGTCLATKAGTLGAKHVLHAVSAWNEASCIGRATQRALLLADELGHRSLAIPALGTGKERVTMETCANAMMTALSWHLRLGGTRLRHVDVVLSDAAKLAVFREVAEEALRDPGASRAGADLGLPAETGKTTVEGATFVDPNQTSGSS
jgi:eukaryotic-like serine/threonine-protein kinase